MRIKWTLGTLISLCILLFANDFAYSQQCPRRISNCHGLCGWYIDNDHDGFCDLTTNLEEILENRKRICDSVANAEREKRIADSLAAIKTQGNGNNGTVVRNDQLNNTLTEEHQAINSDVKKDSVPNMTLSNEAPTTKVTTDENAAFPPPNTQKTYDFFLILGCCSALYLLTFFLSRKNVLKKSTHRKIWNVILLLTFLATGLIGLFLVIQLNYNLLFDWFSSLLFWHVEFGLAMAAISIFHLLWHLRYWLNLFKKSKSQGG